MMHKKALELLKQRSPYGQALENHCNRVAEFTLAIAKMQSIAADEDLVYTGAWLHDIGLCVADPDEPNYLKRGLKFARPYAETWGIQGDARTAFEHMMLYNHSLTSVAGIHQLAELMRKGVQIEHSFGRVSHQVPKEARDRVFSNNPRLDFNRVLFQFFKTSMKEGGPVELFKVFLPTGLASLL